MARPSSRSGRSPAAPRWSAAAARATIRSLESLAPQHHLHSWVKMLELVLRPQEDWQWWRQSITRFASRLQARCAEEVLTHHRARASHMSLEQLNTLADSVARATRRAAKACPALPDIGITPVGCLTPPSFVAWVESPPVGPVRATTPSAGPMSKLAQWNPNGEVLVGVVCCARAESRIRAWRKGAGKDVSSPPPPHLLHAIVRSTVLPTAVASKPDHWWLATESRWLSVREI